MTTNKKLAFGIWGVGFIHSLICIIMNIIDAYYIGVVNRIIGLLCYFLLGYMILRNRNDSRTRITILFAFILSFGRIFISNVYSFISLHEFFTLIFLPSIFYNLAGIVAIILRLVIRKYKNSNTLRRIWYLPAIIYTICNAIDLFSYFSVLALFLTIFATIFYLLFGFWFIKYLD